MGIQKIDEVDLLLLLKYKLKKKRMEKIRKIILTLKISFMILNESYSIK